MRRRIRQSSAIRRCCRRRLPLAAKATINQTFGGTFADELEKLPDNQWSGPVPSSYGLHLVRVTERREGRNPASPRCVDAVAREWSNAKRKALEAERIETLLKRYNVTYRKYGQGRDPLMIRCALFLLMMFQMIAGAAQAHEMRPAYLEIRKTDTNKYSILWKVPAAGDKRLGLYVRMPEACQAAAEPVGTITGGAYYERWSVTCAGGLSRPRNHHRWIAFDADGCAGPYQLREWHEPGVAIDAGGTGPRCDRQSIHVRCGENILRARRRSHPNRS